jgi:hypothetical protein
MNDSVCYVFKNYAIPLEFITGCNVFNDYRCDNTTLVLSLIDESIVKIIYENSSKELEDDLYLINEIKDALEKRNKKRSENDNT